MIELIATAPYCYGGRRLKSGDTFSASEKDANLLTLVGKAKRVEAPAALMPKAQPKKKSANGTYKRRDMRASA